MSTREDIEEHFAGDVRWSDVEANHKDKQTYGAPQPQSDAAHPCAHREHADHAEWWRRDQAKFALTLLSKRMGRW